MSTHILHYFAERALSSNQLVSFMNRRGEYTEVSYAKLWNNILKYAAYYKNLGIEQGDVVSIILPTCEEFIAAFFAAQLLKAVPVALYPPTSLSEASTWFKQTNTLIKSVQSKYLITDYKISPFLDGIKASIYRIDDINQTNEIISFQPDLYSGEDLCFLQFSSGTTGLPKAVIIDQKNALTNTTLIQKSLNLKVGQEVVVGWLPLYHDMGLIGILINSIVLDAKMILIRPDDFIRKPILWLKAMSDYRATSTTAPNFAYGLVQKRVKKEQLQGLDLSSLKHALCGAEMVYKETLTKFCTHLEDTNFNSNAILPVYGMAEATLAVAFAEVQKGMSFITVDKSKLEQGKIQVCDKGIEICSVGKVLDTFELKIIDQDNRPVSQNKTGRILIKGPSVTQGYLNADEKNKTLFSNNWLDTGDEGFLYNGQLYICGRLKDTMIIRGKNIYPTTLEEQIYQINGLRKGRVIVSSIYNSSSNTEEVIVLAELANTSIAKEQKTLIREMVKKIISNESLPLYRVELLLPGTLLKTTSGKLKRRASVMEWKKNRLKKNYVIAMLEKSLWIFRLYNRRTIHKHRNEAVG